MHEVMSACYSAGDKYIQKNNVSCTTLRRNTSTRHLVNTDASWGQQPGTHTHGQRHVTINSLITTTNFLTEPLLLVTITS